MQSEWDINLYPDFGTSDSEFPFSGSQSENSVSQPDLNYLDPWWKHKILSSHPNPNKSESSRKPQEVSRCCCC